MCCSATLLAFLVELLKSSVAMQEQMLGGKGFLVIGYLLEKVNESPATGRLYVGVCVYKSVHIDILSSSTTFLQSATQLIAS